MRDEEYEEDKEEGGGALVLRTARLSRIRCS